MTPPRLDEIWKWIAAALLTIVMFLLGGASGTRALEAELNAHEALGGHPVDVERIGALEKRLDRMEGKIDIIVREVQRSKVDLYVREQPPREQ